jgi:hypothetical protein
LFLKSFKIVVVNWLLTWIRRRSSICLSFSSSSVNKSNPPEEGRENEEEQKELSKKGKKENLELTLLEVLFRRELLERGVNKTKEGRGRTQSVQR